MKELFKQFYQRHMNPSDSPKHSESSTRIAAAALMIEVARADFDFSGEELLRIEQLLRDTLGIDDQELVELVELAQQESKDSTSLHSFTRLIHAEYSDAQKFELFEKLWQVAYADGELDKYEEYLLRKIADLIYLSHQHFMQSKHKVMAQLGID